MYKLAHTTLAPYITLALCMLLAITGYGLPLEAQTSRFDRFHSDAFKHNTPIDPSRYTKQLQEIEQYLNSFTTLSATFTQSTPPSGTLTSGKLYIARPNKARLEYQGSSATELVIHGKRLMYYDKELDQVSYADVPPTPFMILLQHNIELMGPSVTLHHFRDKTHQYILTFSLNNQEQEEAPKEFFTLTFERELQNHRYTLTLSRIDITDSSYTSTVVFLSNLLLNSPLDKALFSLSNPKNQRPRK